MADNSKTVLGGLIPNRRVRKIYLSDTVAGATLQTALNIPSGKGYLLGITVSTDAAGAFLDVVLDGDTLFNNVQVLAGNDMGISIPFNEQYLQSLVIRHRGGSAGNTTIVISYTTIL